MDSDNNYLATRSQTTLQRYDGTSGHNHASSNDENIPIQSNLSVHAIPLSFSQYQYSSGLDEHENPSTDCNMFHDLNELTVLPPDRAPVPISHDTFEIFQSSRNVTIAHLDDSGARAPVPVSMRSDEKYTKKVKKQQDVPQDGGPDTSTAMIQRHSEDEEQSVDDVAAATGNCNHDLMLENQDNLHQTQIPCTLIGRIESLHMSAPNTQIDAGLPRAPFNALSQSAPNDHIRSIDEERPSQVPQIDSSNQHVDEVIFVAEAFRVEADLNVQVAERIQHDERNAMSTIKRTVCILSLIMAVIVIALGVVFAVIINGGRETGNTYQPVETIQGNSLSSRPSSQPSFVPSFRPTERVKESIQENVLEQNMTFDSMKPDDHRVLALDWITGKDLSKLDAAAPNLHQRYILALFAFSVGGDVSWLVLSDQNECDWPGITCKHQGNITKLKLVSKNLVGTITPEIGKLKYLEVLNLNNNSLSGALPSELGDLRNLSSLLIPFNSLTGTLPSEIGYLHQLSVLDLGFNKINGALPAEICDLKSLTYMLMMSNQFTDPLPTEIGKLDELIELDLRFNTLSGTIPNEIIGLINLTRLRLNSNVLNGTLPTEIGGLQSLAVLDISTNQLTGNLPTEIGNLGKLLELSIWNNKLSGPLSSEIGRLYALNVFIAGRNILNGTLPTEIGNLKEVYHLGLDNNHFTGTLPTEIGGLQSLTVFDISTNQFSGSLLTEIGNLSKLQQLSIWKNNLSGPLPSEIGRIYSLNNLGAGMNIFNGTLPAEIGNLKEVYHLGIDNNYFTGTLPQVLEELTALTELLLDGNYFTGPFLSGLKTCATGMSRLCILGKNSYTGSGGNNFTGYIPEPCGDCS